MKTGTMINVGEVVRLRVNPEDVITCIEIVKNSGTPYIGMSLAQIISQALKGFCNYARDNSINGVQPNDGFDYTNIVAPFINNRQGTKLETSETVKNTERARHSMDIPASPVTVTSMNHDGSGGFSVELSEALLKKLVDCDAALDMLDIRLENGTATDKDIVNRKFLVDVIKRLRKGEDVNVVGLL